MRQEETRLGVRFEDDYLEKVMNGEWGQKRFSNRWHVRRSLIFRRLQGGRRSWIEMLDLPSPSNRDFGVEKERSKKGCAVCGAANAVLEKAHWIPRRDGFTKAGNLESCSLSQYDFLAASWGRGRDALATAGGTPALHTQVNLLRVTRHRCRCPFLPRLSSRGTSSPRLRSSFRRRCLCR